MTRAEIVELVERAKTAWRDRNLDLLMSAVAEDCIVESPAHGTLVGRARIAEVSRTWLSFPDVQFDVTDLLVEGDAAVVFWRLTATHTAELLGFPPTGRRLELRAISRFTLRDGLIVRERRFFDVAALLVQMGAVKARPA